MALDFFVMASLLIGATPAAIYEALADPAFRPWGFAVTAAEPPTRLAWKGTGWLGLQTTVRAFAITPTEDYRVRVTATEQVEGPFVAFLAPPDAERKAALEAFLRDLKRRTSLP